MRNIKYLILCFFYFAFFNLNGQNSLGKSDDYGRIAISTFVPDQAEEFSDIVRQNFSNKLNQVVTNYGFSGSEGSRFIMVPFITVQNKEITNTAPSMTVLSLSISLYIGDGIEGIKFATYSTGVKGVGNNDTKAYIAALKSFRTESTELSAFLEKGKNKIIEYYNSKCDFIQKKAKTLAGNRNYDEAIYELSIVPEICKSCYTSSMDLSNEIFNQKLEFECQSLISQAKSFIAQNKYDEAAEMLAPIIPGIKCYSLAETLLNDIQNHRCAIALGKAKGAWASRNIEETSKFLSEIETDSKCSGEANQLADEVRKWAKEKDGREWNFAMKVHNDNVDLRKRSIDAVKAVGVAYGKNQPKVVYNIRAWR